MKKKKNKGIKPNRKYKAYFHSFQAPSPLADLASGRVDCGRPLLSAPPPRPADRVDLEVRLPLEDQAQFGGGGRGHDEGDQQDPAGEHPPRPRGRALPHPGQGHPGHQPRKSGERPFSRFGGELILREVVCCFSFRRRSARDTYERTSIRGSGEVFS